MIRKKKILKIAIDSPAAAGAGTLAKAISKHYNLFYLDTGKIYRFVANLKIIYPKKFNNKFIIKKIKSLRMKDLSNKSLLSNKVATVASMIAKEKKIRKIIYNFQLECAHNPPKKYSTSVILKSADLKFFITANVKTRAMRRYKELKSLKNQITYEEVLKSIKNRDKNDYNRKISPLKKTKDSILINTTKLSKRACFLKIKKIIDRKLAINGNL